jgi:glycosyl transferase family 87
MDRDVQLSDDGRRSPLAAWLELRRQRLAFVLTREWLLWFLVAVFWLRLAFFVLADPVRPDGAAIIAAGGDFLHHPGHLYTAAAAFLARTGYMAPFGWSGPPGAMLLVAPFAMLPPRPALGLWTLADAVAILAGLWLLYSATRPAAWRRPLFFLTAAYFPPVFAEIDAGQIGGFMFLLGCGSLWLNSRRHTGWAGALAGVAAAIKIYPAGLLFGVGPRRLRSFVIALVGTAVVVTLAGFARLGFGAIGFYIAKILLPSLRAPLPDCEVNSPHTLIGRWIGGDPFFVLTAGGGTTRMQSPLHLPAVASVTTDLLLVALVVIAIWAAWKSAWHPVYGPSLGFALGALVVSEVNVYQMLPMLPLVLVTGVRAAERGAYGVLGLLLLPMLALLRQPCYLPFPDLWTVAMLALFGICAWNWRLFAPAGAETEHQQQ